ADVCFDARLFLRQRSRHTGDSNKPRPLCNSYIGLFLPISFLLRGTFYPVRISALWRLEVFQRRTRDEPPIADELGRQQSLLAVPRHLRNAPLKQPSRLLDRTMRFTKGH